MLGGIARRATAINQMGSEPKLILDLGDFSTIGKDPFTMLKIETLLESYVAIGYDAVNIGRYEISQGKEFILKANDMLGGKMISANVLDGSGNHIVQPYLMKDYGSLRVGVIGVAMHQSTLAKTKDGSKPELMTREPIEALEEFIPVMREKDGCDIIIVAGMMLKGTIEDIAQEFDGQVDVILSGQGFNIHERTGGYAYYYANPEGPVEPGSAPKFAEDESNKRETKIILHKNSQQGKYLGKIYAPLVNDENDDFTIGEFEGLTLDMDNNIPDAPEIVDILDHFHEQVRENRREFVANLLGQQVEHYWQDFPPYVGSRHCGKCHKPQAGDFPRTRHAQSMRVLTESKENDNPECLKCHTTGYGEPEGFISTAKTQYLAKVDCEACHGPAKEHIGIEVAIKEARKQNSRNRATDEENELLASIRDGYDTKIRKEVPEEICLQCHTSEWSPDFDYDEYVLKVNHRGFVPGPGEIKPVPGFEPLEGVLTIERDGITLYGIRTILESAGWSVHWVPDEMVAECWKKDVGNINITAGESRTTLVTDSGSRDIFVTPGFVLMDRNLYAPVEFFYNVLGEEFRISPTGSVTLRGK